MSAMLEVWGELCFFFTIVSREFKKQKKNVFFYRYYNIMVRKIYRLIWTLKIYRSWIEVEKWKVEISSFPMNECMREERKHNCQTKKQTVKRVTRKDACMSQHQSLSFKFYNFNENKGHTRNSGNTLIRLPFP
jgi:hypothetical protein